MVDFNPGLSQNLCKDFLSKIMQLELTKYTVEPFLRDTEMITQNFTLSNKDPER